MCNPDIQNMRKRSFDDAAFSFDSMENPLKKQLTQPSFVSIMKADMMRQRQAAKADPICSGSMPEQVASTNTANTDEDLLEETFQPGNWHVIYGREKSHKEHIGNKRLRVLIADKLKVYILAPTRREKSKIIDEVASQIRLYGGFVKKTAGGRWLSIGHAQSREKVGHSFRDCMKLFKGNKPESKQAQWTEAQNSIFTNLNLKASPQTPVSYTPPASPLPESLPESTPMPTQVFSAEPVSVVSQDSVVAHQEQLPFEEITLEFPIVSLEDMEPLPLW